MRSPGGCACSRFRNGASVSPLELFFDLVFLFEPRDEIRRSEHQR